MTGTDKGGIDVRFYGDYHIHSRESDGRQTVREIAEVAVKRGLKEVAITNHGPYAAGIGVKNAKVFLKLREEIDRINQEGYDVKILLGAEANIRDLDGTLDIKSDIIECFDLLIVGLHPYTLPTSVMDGMHIFLQNSFRHLGRRERAKAVRNNTIATVAALYNNPDVDILSHPGLFFNVDIEEVARACKENNVLFEINCGHEYPKESDIIKAERVGVNFIVNSDSHFQDTVGYLKYGSLVIDNLKISPERVMNSFHLGGVNKWKTNMKVYRYS